MPKLTHQPTHQQGTKWASNGEKCQIWSSLGKKSFFTVEIKSFVTHITENPPGHLVHIGFWSGIGQNVQKMAIFGPKWRKMHILEFGPILDVFGPKILIFMGVSKSFGTHIMEKPPKQLVCIVFWSAIRSNGPKCQYLAQKASFGPNFAVFGPKIQFFGGRE